MVHLSGSFALVGATLISGVMAHIRLGETIPGYGRQQGLDPFTNRSPLNSFNEKIKFDMAFCKNLHKKGTPKTVSKLKIGNNTFDLETDMAPHGGGSMQISLSFDKGESFRVLKSWIGGYPRNGGQNNIDKNQTYDFNIPEGTKSGEAILSWSWSNLIGNREWYQDCAPVEIPGNGTGMLEGACHIFVSDIPLSNCKNDYGGNVEYPCKGDDEERIMGKNVDGAPNKAPKGSDCDKQIKGSMPPQALGPAKTEKKSGSVPPAPSKEGDKPKQDDPKKDEPKKDEPKKDEPKKDDPKKEETKKDDPKKNEPKKDEPKKENSPSSGNPEMYKIKEGDTCDKLAGMYGTTVSEIIKLNDLKPDCKLEKDASIKVPKKKTDKPPSSADPDMDDDDDGDNYTFIKRRDVKPVVTVQPTFVSRNFTYTVKKDDNCEKIADLWAVDVQKLMKRNNITTGCKQLKEGNKLKLRLSVAQHTVKKDETCGSIAKANEIPESKITLFNPDVKCPTLTEKRVLYLPRKQTIYWKDFDHKVVKDETCATISKKYGVKQKAFLKTNNLKKEDCKKLTVGKTLKVSIYVRQYVVKTLDTCKKVASKYKTSQKVFMLINKIDDKCSNLQLGKTVYVKAKLPKKKKNSMAWRRRLGFPRKFTYETVAGDTCQKVASRYGIKAKALYKANKKKITDKCKGALKVKTKLVIKTRVKFYMVKKNDTCASIAKARRISAARIQLFNKLTKETCKDLKDKKSLVLPLTPKPLVRTVKYKLLKGDTCKSVATKFNVPEKAIKKGNKIMTCTSLSLLLRKTVKIGVPVSKYRIKKGDTCVGIIDKAKTTKEVFYLLNKLDDKKCSNLKPKRIVYVPRMKKTKKPAVKKP